MRVVPNNWVACTLGQLGTWSSGGTPSRSRPDFYEGSIPWVKTGELTDGPIADAEEHITEEALTCSSAKVFPEGSLAIAMYGATIGKLGVLARPLATNQACAVLLADSTNREILPFVFNYLLSERGNLKSRGIGGAQPNISQMILKAYPAVVAPLDEQKRICNTLDSCLSRLDAAEAGLKRVQANLKRYRASVLKAAVEGRLVPTEAELAKKEGRTYEPASTLLERILKERRKRWEEAEFAKFKAAGKLPKDDKWKAKYKEPAAPDTKGLPELPEGWCWATWDQVGRSQNGRAFPSAKYQTTGVRLLRPGNLFANGRVVWSETNTRCMPEAFADQFPTYLVGSGEMVMNLTAQSLKDEFLGRVCLTGPDERCLLNQRIARLTANSCSQRFILWMLKSPSFRSFVDGLNTGSLIQHMFTTQLAEFTFPLPPRTEQERIALECDRLMSIADNLHSTSLAEISRMALLRQSILKWAFEGKLVDQDPNDEPASVLLDRIRAERDSAAKTTKTRNPRAKKKAS